MRLLTASVALLALAIALPAAAEEPSDGFSRPRVASGTHVIRPHSGSLPFDGDWDALAAVPSVRNHYRWDPDYLRDVRQEAYVSPSIGEGTLPGAPAADGGFGPAAPPRKRTFNGLNRMTSAYLGFTAFPPDANVSASQTKVIQATNVALRMTSRTGSEIDRIPLNNFFGFDSNNLLFDPKVFFDHMSGRFYIVALEQSESPRRSGIWIAVSRDADPALLDSPSEFCTYRMNGKRGGSWADYPTIGINEDWFSIGVNNFRFDAGGFRRAHIYVMKVDRITNNAQGCPTLGVKRFSRATDSSGEPIFGYHPVQHYSPDVANNSPLYIVNTAFFLPSARYTIWRVTKGAGGAAQLSHQFVEGNFQYTFAPVAKQRGGADLDGGDPRITQAAYRNGRVWLTQGTACSIGALPNEGCVRAVEINPTASGGAQITFSQTYGQANTFLFWPGIAINQAGDVLVVAQKAKASQYLRTVYNGKRAGASSFDNLRNLGNGSCALVNMSAGATVNRTGDYVGLQTDPLDHLGFWFTGELPGSLGAGFGCDWKTKVARAKYNN